MASGKQIRDEIMRMTIVVNSNPAQQEIYALTEANRKFTAESKKLKEERVQVGKTLGRNSQEYKDLTAQIDSNSSTIVKNRQKIMELSDTLEVSQMSVKQLKQEAILLRRELDRVVPGSNQYNALQEQLRQVNGRLSEVRNGASNASTSFEDLADRFNQYSGIIAAGLAVLVGFGVSIKTIIDRNNAMADAMTAVEKTTGLARSEVEELSRSFSDFDTRTKKIDLLKMAEVGGRLGVAKGEIKDFTQEVDKAFVALGDSWKGTVEDLANSLGKTANLYSETKDLPIATAINQIGSALNELAASGASSEQNISDFVLRMGRVPQELRPPLNTLLGYGSAFEELGINAEIGASGFSKFIRVAAADVEGFAKIMNQPLEKVRELINTNPSEFFLKFSEGLKGLDGDQVANILKELKLADQEVQGAIGAASSNSDLFRESVEKANLAVKEATSLQKEFDKVNNNAAGIWEKTQRKIAESITAQSVAKYLNSLIEIFGKFIGAIEDSKGNITSFRNGLVFFVKIIVLLTATMFTYNLVTGVYNALMLTAYQRVLGLTIVEKARNAVMLLANGIATLYRATLWLLAAGYSLVTGNIVGATFAMRGFSAAIAANPLGAILTLIGLVASAYLYFSSTAEEAANKQRSLNTAMEQGTKNATDDIAALEVLYKTATNVKNSTDERLKAVLKLKEQFPSYFAGISDEIIMNGKAAKSYHELRAAIVASARADAAKDELKRRAAERFTRDEDWKKDMVKEVLELKRLEESWKEIQSIGKDTYYRTMEMKTRIDNQKQIIEQKKAQLLADKIKENKSDDIYVKAIGDNIDKAGPYISDKNKSSLDPNSNYNVPGNTSTTTSSTSKQSSYRNIPPKSNKEEDLHQEEMKAMIKRGEDATELARQIAQDLEDAKIEAMEEGYSKELAAINLQEDKKMEEIDKKRIKQFEFDYIDKKIAKATGDDKIFFEKIKELWIKNNEELEKVKIEEAKTFDIKRNAIEAKQENEWLKNYEDNFQKELSQLERQKNEELAKYQSLAEMKEALRARLNDNELENITTWEEGKEALNKIYQKQEIEMQVAHLQTMVELYKGLDMNILTKEQREEVLKFIEEAGNKIAEFKAKANDVEQSKKAGPNKGEKLGGQGSTDILGMSPKDWDTFFNNIKTGTDALGTAQAAVGALQSAFSTYYEFVKANEEAQMRQIEKTAKRKEITLKRQLDSGQLNQTQYEEAIQNLNNETEKKKAQLEYDAAKREKNYKIGQTIANTAQAIMNIWATSLNPITAGILTGIVGAIGLVQVATIAKQPLPEAPGFEYGFGMEYPIKRQQDGKTFRVKRKPLTSGLVSSPTHFIAGERGTEMVIDSPTYTRFRPELKRAIANGISSAKGFENGMYNNSGSSENEEKLMKIIEQNTLAMSSIINKKFTAHIGKNMENAKEIIDMNDEYNSYKNSAKR